MNAVQNEKALVNCKIYTGDCVLTNHAVWIRDDKIISTPELSNLPEGVETIDLNGLTVAPAFIDAQINGGGGVLFNDVLDTEGLKTISEAHEKYGVLNFCPTIISTDMNSIDKGLQAVQAAMSANTGVIGAHIEGPFIEKTKAGVHDKRFIRSAEASDIDRLTSWNDKVIRIVTVAPESCNYEYIERLANRGIKVFVGHTNTTCDLTLESFKRGCVGVTHLYNAMSQLGSREPGVVGASFFDRNSWAGIIVDGYHVDYRAVVIAKQNKGNKLFFVTDAMPPVGKPDVVYCIGEYEISCVDGRCSTKDGTLAGSALDMASAVRNAVQKCNIPKDEALRMASTYVAQMLGISELGNIKAGAYADMVILNGQLSVDAVVRRGEYRKINTSDIQKYLHPE